MPTAPKIIKRTHQVDTSTIIDFTDSGGASTTSGNIGQPEYQVDTRNRKERRKAESSKRHRRGKERPQRGIYNAFYGY